MLPIFFPHQGEMPSCPSLEGALEVFPPDKVCEDGRSMVDIHLLEVMASYSKKIFTFFESSIGRYIEAKNKNTFPVCYLYKIYAKSRIFPFILTCSLTFSLYLLICHVYIYYLIIFFLPRSHLPFS